MDIDHVVDESLEDFDNNPGAQDNNIERSLVQLLTDLDQNTETSPQPAVEDGLAHDGEILREPVEEDALQQQEKDAAHKTPASVPTLGSRIEVAIPEMTLEKRREYSFVRSDIIEAVFGELPPKRGHISYHVEFTDGREELIPSADLVALKNGRPALARFNQGLGSLDSDSMAESRKRKRAPEDEWHSDRGSVASDPMEIDEDDADEGPVVRRRVSSHPVRLLRSRETTKQLSHSPSMLIDNDDNDDLEDLRADAPAPTRSLRTRQPRQTTLTSLSFKNGNGSQDLDELVQDAPPAASSDEEDHDFMPIVVSDLVLKKGRPSKARQRSRRLQSLSMRQKSQSRAARQKSHDSDIEFEAPRRSSRATRNITNMQDDALMDEDSFYVIEDRTPGAPRISSVKENFQPLPSGSEFASMHMQSCHTCGGSRQRGQIVYCQGCTLSYHKACLGVRSARDHLVTKVGEEDFVLQCRFCTSVPSKRDENAPKHSMCQGCKVDGRACTPFSEKKTARQEEKLREQNEGVDPITHVSSKLMNNSDLVLFRCVACHRGWHVEHLPGAGNGKIGTDLKSERLKDHSIDWQCRECGTVKHKMHRLVAWRPVQTDLADEVPRPACNEVKEDDKEYLVKWETRSYAHCTWKPGAWVYGVAASAMRVAFGKRASEKDLLKLDEKNAIPDEFIMPDIILNAKFHSSVPRPRTKEDELANMANVSRIFVKFQGLGYDDVVWDSPPTEDMGDIYASFVEAYYEYVEGKYFKSESNHKIKDRVKAYKAEAFEELEEQPAGLKRGKLMGYQLEGVNWLLGNYHQGRSVVLADEMGLGKTVQVVGLVTSLIQYNPNCWPFLIVVPNATCPNWRREFKQWAPDVRVVAYHGGKAPQELAYKYELFPNQSMDMKAHVVIMSYDSAQDPQTKTLFKSISWQGLVVDEGQRLKNDQNLLYGALRSMKIPFRLLLTGTPLQNNKRELFNLLQFIDEAQKAEELDAEYAVLDKETLPKLHSKIRPYFLRRTKAGVLKFLPPMSQIILPVTMTVIQEKLAKSIMAKNPELIKAMFSNSKMNKKERGSLNNILMQLRKCLCHPFMYSEAIEERHHDPTVLYRNLVEASGKLLLLENMLPKLKERGHRVLVFSQFLQQLDIIEDFLGGLGYEYRRLDGSMGSLEKQRRIDAFNAPESSVFAFLLSTRAGGVGINLATADTVIILDPDFNPHQDIQALSRAHRIGQKNKVLCFQLMTTDSVEERIMQIGKKKMALDHALIESMDDDDLAGDDLESILKHGAQALFSDTYEKKSIHYDSAAVDALLSRTSMEETKADDETAFSYARVWSNEKTGFEAGLATEETHEPEALNSSVWDRILAQREAEARREAEANREVLGRGGRRRQAINYKTNAIDAANLLGEAEPESSDDSDAFAGGDSGEESDEEEHLNAKGNRLKNFPSQPPTPAATPKKPLKSSKIDKKNTQTPKKPASTSKRPTSVTPNRAKSTTKTNLPKPKAKQPVTNQADMSKVGGPNKQQNGQAQGFASWQVNSRSVMPREVTHQMMANPYPRVQSNPQAPTQFSRYIKDSYRSQSSPAGVVPPQHVFRSQLVAPPIIDFRSIHMASEAEVRLALDWLQHSGSDAGIKRQQKAALLSRLLAFSSRSGSL
ncbi:hypothetical protein FZEAL_7928 [Fusarium zealandicum]|uniref:Chromatin remodeling factor mit1 n=1 Tax=Fusarium zealandicum TaxID=1053134 RepID=A0A8H4UFJ5_9HYPO|nr:hypothetical protein FZEAL_7928 [Fusarium zealandicum]